MYTLYFIVVMLAPAAMLIVGLKWKISPPPYRFKGLAYSTELTRNNPDAWQMAHRHCSRLWMRTGIISGGASAFLMILFWENYSTFWMWLIVGQMVLFCVSVFMIDLLIKNTFHDGSSDEMK
ncbi:MAG: SdpI family protein [Lawsonibacter sp.]|nr:SdpI family protein [Lawsonibacter sp.]